MMLVVAGVSGTTLFVLQQRVQANYERMFRKQFDRQINYFLRLQETRLAAVRDQSLSLAESSIVLRGMLETQTATNNVYLAASNEMRTVLASMSQEWRLALSSGSSRKVSAMFFRFLDGRGYMIDPPESMQRQLGMPLAKRRLEQRFA